MNKHKYFENVSNHLITNKSVLNNSIKKLLIYGSPTSTPSWEKYFKEWESLIIEEKRKNRNKIINELLEDE